MRTKQRSMATKAKELWDRNDHQSLVQLSQTAAGAKDSDVLYFAGLAYNALNKKREAIECWRKATKLPSDDDKALRALAYELADSDPINASDLFYRLIARNHANADDFTSLGEIRIKQDRLGEAQQLLQRALKLEKNNGLALLAMASLYANVRDRDLALDYLRKLSQAGTIDVSDLAFAPEFEFLWHDPQFEQIVCSNGE